MLKETLIILLIVGLPTVILMNYDSVTGALTNEFAEIRKYRLLEYHEFPLPFNPIQKHLAANVKNGLRAGANEDFYGPDRLLHGNEFFENELQLMASLIQLSCITPIGEPKGRFITPSGKDIILVNNKFQEITYEQIKQIPCNEELLEHAQHTIGNILDIDANLVHSTIKSSNCPQKATETYTKALEDIKYGSIESAINNLKLSWQQAQC